ncbi:MAG: hypothetical protein WBF75_04190 [Pseudonocardiaceae bacterium]
MDAKRRSAETITALLSTAPPLVEERGSKPKPPVVDQPPAPDDGDLDDSDLEAFELQADAPLIRPRRRRQVDYQTVRINRPTAQVLRAQWLIARRHDPLLSYTEFSTIAVQSGLRALKEQRERGE